MTLLLIAPFTRLVHVWSIPLSYLWRPYQIVRRRQAPLRYGTRAWPMSSSAPDLVGVRRTTGVDVPQRGPGDKRGTTAVAARAHIVRQPAPANLSVGETAITETDIAREMQYHPGD
jgi:hypothetical protein